MPERQGGRVPTVHVMIDSDDDIRFSAAVWRRCRLGSGRLAVSPPPSVCSKTTLMLHIVEALRPALPPGPWKYLDAEEPLASTAPIMRPYCRGQPFNDLGTTSSKPQFCHQGG